MIERLLIDTSHFKGNAPALCSVEGVHAPGVAADNLTGWRTLLRSPLQPHTQHVFDDELRRIGPVTEKWGSDWWEPASSPAPS